MVPDYLQRADRPLDSSLQEYSLKGKSSSPAQQIMTGARLKRVPKDPKTVIVRMQTPPPVLPSLFPFAIEGQGSEPYQRQKRPYPHTHIESTPNPDESSRLHPVLVAGGNTVVKICNRCGRSGHIVRLPLACVYCREYRLISPIRSLGNARRTLTPARIAVPPRSSAMS